MKKNVKATKTVQSLIGCGVVLLGSTVACFNAPLNVHAAEGASTSLVGSVNNQVSGDTPAVASTGWDARMAKVYTSNGKNYKLVGISDLSGSALFRNTVTSLADGQEHTYTKQNTGTYYIRDHQGKEYWLYDFAPIWGGDDKELRKTQTAFPTEDEDVAIDLKERVIFTSTGAIEHTVTMKNRSDHPIADYSLGVSFSPDLDGNDKVNLYADGNGGIFFKNDALTVHSEGLDGTRVYVRNTEDTSKAEDQIPATGNYGQPLVQGQKSSIEYETDKMTLAPGESYTFKFRERFEFPADKTSQMTVRYVDDKGNQLKDEGKLEDVVGKNYTITAPTIEGFVFESSSDPLTGTYGEENKTITLVYKAKSTEGTETTPSNPENPDNPDNPSKPTNPENPVTPEKPTNPENPVTPETPMVPENPVVPGDTSSQSNSANTNQSAKLPNSYLISTKPSANTSKALPQTGEKSDTFAGTIGLGILATMTLFGLTKLDKNVKR